MLSFAVVSCGGGGTGPALLEKTAATARTPLLDDLHHSLSYRLQNPLTGPVHLTLTTPPLHLTFVGPSQRLARIQVTGSRPGSHVAYRSQRVQEPGRGTTREEEEEVEEEDEDEGIVKRIRRILGPTYGSSKAPVAPGTIRADPEEILSYPGVAFGISTRSSGPSCPHLHEVPAGPPPSTDSRSSGHRAGAQQLQRIVVTPLPAPESQPIDQAWLHPKLDESRIAVAHGDLARATIEVRPPLKRISSALLNDERYCDQLPRGGESSRPKVTLAFHSLSDPPPSRTNRRGDGFRPVEPVVLEIGETTSEDVLCDLGSAIRTFWKEDVSRA